MSDPEYIRFIGGPPNRKTKIWFVVAKATGSRLGEVLWFARWRRYAFVAFPDNVFEEDCLRAIADFCESRTQAHRAASVRSKVT